MKIKTYIYITFTLVLALTRWAEASDFSRADYYDALVMKQALKDGVSIALHYYPDKLKPYNTDPDGYAFMIMEYAKEAYSTIVYGLGFDSPGFTYANPDKYYCCDEDMTIDIYIGDFQNAPCYDIIRGEGRDYDAVILFPADYLSYVKKWYNENLSGGDINKRIKGTIYHEMFHLITYSYNKNVEPWSAGAGNSGGDWYTEGLARYVETISGSYNNFFSKGFTKKSANNKNIIFHGGANYLMEHPEDPLLKGRYNYSLFWAYLHKKYGMEKIEEISRKLRYITEKGISSELPSIISTALKDDFKDVMEGFSIAMYFKHFNPDVRSGLSQLKIMSLDDFRARSPKKLSSYGSNFITLNLTDEATPGQIAIRKTDKNGHMRMNVFCRLESGRIAHLRQISLEETDNLCEVDLYKMRDIGVKEVILVITNVDADYPILYNLLKY